MSYAGIDYGCGTQNVDRATGIRFGVISQNSVNLDCWADAEPDYGKPHCPECGDECLDSSHESVTDAEWNDGKDYACAKCEACYWSDSVFPDEALSYSYEREGYKLTDCLDTDIFILESPYFTWAQFCSPCVPGAGNLDTPTEPENGAKCYALGHDWFEDGRAPYTVYRVADGSIVEPEA